MPWSAKAMPQEEAGDLLFSAVNLLRKLGMDAESALNAACRKFISRIQKMETYAKQAGKNWKNCRQGSKIGFGTGRKCVKKAEKGLYCAEKSSIIST